MLTSTNRFHCVRLTHISMAILFVDYLFPALFSSTISFVFCFFRPTPTTSWIQLALTSKKKAQMAAALPQQQRNQNFAIKGESHKYHTVILEYFSAKE